MNAREVNLLVAQRVFGLKLDDEDSRLVRVPVDHPSCPPGTTLGNSPKPYATDASAAWTVAEELRTMNLLYSISPSGDETEPWRVRVWVDGNQRDFYAATMPEALCRAALAALTPTRKAKP
jgi:hypothetical protein